MKNSNKIIIAGAIICAFCIGLLSALFVRVSKTESNSKSLENDQRSIKTESNISKSVTDNQSTESYVIKLEDCTICAYVVLSDGKSVLWNSTPVSPDLSYNDKQILQEGITTDSFEELCLYFEAYSS